MPILPESTALHLVATVTDCLRNTALSPAGVQAALAEICRLTGSTSGALFYDQAEHREDGAVSVPIHQWGDFLPSDQGDSLENNAGPGRYSHTLSLRPAGAITLVLKHHTARPPDGVLREGLELTLQIIAGFFETRADYVRMLKTLSIHPLSHLPDWEGFLEDVTRRVPRLDRDGSPATLMIVRLERTSGYRSPSTHNPSLNAARFLRQTVRPTDLVGQIGTDTFILWLDGGDRFAGAERAEQISHEAFETGPHPTARLRVGLVTREPGSVDSLDILLERARLGLYIAQRENVPWRFFHEEA